jgi:RHS repeat-associated protein
VLVKETNRNGLSFYFEYDWEHPEGWCTRTWGDGGIYDHRITYDKNGHMTLVEDSRGGRTHYFGNNVGIVVKKIDPMGGAWKYEWDDKYRKTAEEDPLGHRTEWEYDDRGNKTLERDATGCETRWKYNEFNLPVEMTDAGGCQWTREYDTRGQLTTAVNPIEGQYHYVYDTNGAPIRMRDPDGRILSFRFNDTGDLIERTDIDGHTTRYDVDDLGHIVRVFDQIGRTTTMTWDACGQMTRVEHPDGYWRQIKYDREGNSIQSKDSNRRITSCRYGGYSWLVERVDSSGSVVQFEYDSEGTLASVINPNQEVFKFENDLAGRLVREHGFDGREIEYRYNRAGQCVESLDAKRRTTHIEYDACGRVVSKVTSDGHYANYKYNSLGQLVTATNSEGDVCFERDELGRITRESFGDTEINRRYDHAGNLVWHGTSLGHQATYDFDSNGGLQRAAITEANRQPWEIHIKRDGKGHELERCLSGDLVSRWEYNSSGRIQSHHVARGSQELWSRGYNWRAGGELATRIDPELGPTKFDHDDLGQLIAAQKADGKVQHRALDTAKNLFRTPGHNDRIYGAGGVLQEADGVQYFHDADGQLVKRILPDNSCWTYEWDTLGQLRQVIRPDDSKITFAYDAIGRRISKSVGEKTTQYIWDSNDLIHEVREGSSPITWAFEPGRFAPLAKIEGDICYGVVSDHLGTPVALYDESGELAWKGDLDIYGLLSSDLNQTECPWRWPGQYEDEETGLYYNRFRYYDPSLGQYISQDPIGLWGGLELYRYTSDPLRWVDPFGLSGCTPAGRELTEHAEESLLRHGFKEPFSHVDNIIENATRRMAQEDGSLVYIMRNAGRHRTFDIVIEGEGGIVTGMRNLTRHELSNLANNYGWTPWL